MKKRFNEKEIIGFLQTNADALFRFSAGTYSLELLASLVGRKRLVSLWNIDLKVPTGKFDASVAVNKAIFYSWSPQKHDYVMSVEDRFGLASKVSDPSDSR